MVVTQEKWRYTESKTRSSDSNPEKSKQLVFYNTRAYEGKRIPFSQMKEEVSTYFSEHLMRPRKRIAYFDGEDWFHPDGTRYRIFFNEAIVNTKDDRARDRFGHEANGWDKAGEIAMCGSMSPFLILSHPDDVYRNPAFGAKSMTFIALPVGAGDVDLAGTVRSVYGYEVYSLPSRELSINEHMGLARELFMSAEEWEMGLKLARELGPNFLVENPFVVNGMLDAINTLVAGMGYENFDQVKEQTEKILEVENDPKAKERREGLIDFFATNLKEENESVWSSDRERVIKMEAIADVMHYYFAMEAGAAYIGIGFDAMVDTIKQDILDKVFEKTPQIYTSTLMTSYEYLEYMERETVRMMMLRSNEKAYESYMVTGCTVNMTQSGQDLWKYSNNFTDLRANQYSDFLSTGFGNDLESKESYSFDIRGICVGSCWDEIDEKGNKIKHERYLGPCHLCEECDHKIQSQVE